MTDIVEVKRCEKPLCCYKCHLVIRHGEKVAEVWRPAVQMTVQVHPECVRS